MKETEVLKYDAPLVEVVEVKVEKGFQASVNDGGGTSGDVDID